MKVAKLFVMIGLAMLSTLALASTAAALPFAEIGDAGDLPGTAQAALGTGPLTDIIGNIASSSDQDMFLISIINPATFSASTNNGGTGLTGNDDTQLFLFDLDGIGVRANDDDPAGGTLKSAIPSGSFSGPVGSYYLAISIYDNDPLSVGGEIFPDAPSDSVFGPAGPGGGSPITSWSFDPDLIQTGDYTIELTGASFAVVAVPEPATMLLLGGGLLGLAVFRRKFRK